jgi:hypothetical protein
MQQLGSLACTAALISHQRLLCSLLGFNQGTGGRFELFFLSGGTVAAVSYSPSGHVAREPSRLNGVFRHRGRKNGIRILVLILIGGVLVLLLEYVSFVLQSWLTDLIPK